MKENWIEHYKLDYVFVVLLVTSLCWYYYGTIRLPRTRGVSTKQRIIKYDVDRAPNTAHWREFPERYKTPVKYESPASLVFGHGDRTYDEHRIGNRR